MKKVFLGLGSVVVLLLVVAAILPAAFRVERSIEIGRAPAEVFAFISDFNQWPKWSPWYTMDPKAYSKVEGTAGTVGQSMSWDGEKVGAGSMTVTAIDKNKSISSELKFTRPNQMVSTARFELEPTTGGGTIVKWINEGTLHYPMGRFFGPFLDKLIGGDFAKGLEKLKEVTESSTKKKG